MDKDFEIVIVGLGALGSASLYQLAKNGNNVLGIDQFHPPHQNGSSHGGSRIIRQAIGEGEEYVPLVLRSYEIWSEIERLTGKKLYEKCGCLILAKPHSAFLKQTINTALKYLIPHQVLTATQVKQRFPQFKIRKEEIGYYEKNGGFLRPELCIESQLALAKNRGAKLILNERVVGIIPLTSGGFRVSTTKGEYKAQKVVITAGAWVTTFLPGKFIRYFKSYRQVQYWFDVGNDFSLFSQGNLPVFIWEFTDNKGLGDYIYGFPLIDGLKAGVKVATEQFLKTSTPDDIQRRVTSKEILHMYKKYIRPYVPIIRNQCIKTSTCLYYQDPTTRFLIDFHPSYPQMVIASGSGHGFKHSAAIGEIVSELINHGRSKIDISKFSFKNFCV